VLCRAVPCCATQVEKAPLESYADVGGLEQQVQEIKEAVELPLTHPELYEDIGIKPPKVQQQQQQQQQQQHCSSTLHARQHARSACSQSSDTQGAHGNQWTPVAASWPQHCTVLVYACL
jgi:hypothetical protein